MQIRNHKEAVMNLFRKKEIDLLRNQLAKNDMLIKQMGKEINRLNALCAEKDSFFMELMSDAMRHGSSLAAKHMADRKSFLKGR